MLVEFRQAKVDDLPDTIRVLADEFLGQQQERLEDLLPFEGENHPVAEAASTPPL